MWAEVDAGLESLLSNIADIQGEAKEETKDHGKARTRSVSISEFKAEEATSSNSYLFDEKDNTPALIAQPDSTKNVTQDKSSTIESTTSTPSIESTTSTPSILSTSSTKDTVEKTEDKEVSSRSTEDLSKVSIEQKRKVVDKSLRSMHGYLSVLEKEWKLRFFVINIKDQELIYFVDNTLSKEKGKLALINANIEILNGEINGKSNCFVIKSKQKEITLTALVKNERSKWVGALDLASHGVLSLTNAEVESIYDEEISNLEEMNHVNQETKNAKRMSSKNTIISVPMAACCGWVEKMKKDVHGKTAWKRRWLVLSDPKYSGVNFLFYFESGANGGSNKKGEIALFPTSRVEKQFKGKKKNVFVVSTKRDDKPTEFEIACSTFEECNIWVRSISNAIASMNQTK